ncbi:hypothetical protein M8C21_000205 [Ambrosia artemisiifolia]|uniref:Uncharacterized protein n=1 Tax=Ambrosia artemisiifolia TaxID=4212 RepID=A0AAD5GA60_AMBAR|nr:hypothetical protein M8C21_000205 [Ambrosia artemisiifolia]
MTLVNSTSDEKLLGKGLALNDTLMRVLRRHDDIAKGVHPTQAVVTTATESSVAPLVNVTHEDDESDDDFGHLAHRGQNRNQNATRTESLRAAPILPPPPSSKRPISSDSGMTVDYLSGDTYTSKLSTPSPPPKPASPPPPSDDYINPTASLFAAERAYPKPSYPEPSYPEPSYPEPTYPQPKYPEPTYAEPTYAIPPPPAKHGHRQNFFDQNQTSRSSGGSASSYDSLTGQARNLSLDSKMPPKKEKPEDALFKDLVDFAKAKSSTSSSSSSYPNRSF